MVMAEGRAEAREMEMVVAVMEGRVEAREMESVAAVRAAVEGKSCSQCSHSHPPPGHRTSGLLR